MMNGMNKHELIKDYENSPAYISKKNAFLLVSFCGVSMNDIYFSLERLQDPVNNYEKNLTLRRLAQIIHEVFYKGHKKGFEEGRIFGLIIDFEKYVISDFNPQEYINQLNKFKENHFSSLKEIRNRSIGHYEFKDYKVLFEDCVVGISLPIEKISNDLFCMNFYLK